MNSKQIIVAIILFGISSAGIAQSTALYHTILKLDSVFFQAYNDCDLTKQSEFYSDSIEFFHDKTGLETSKEKILEDTKKFVCGKVRRELVKGSMDVSPIPGYGAVATGLHKFHNRQNHSSSSSSRFVIIWRYKNEKWTIAKVISLHQQAQ